MTFSEYINQTNPQRQYNVLVTNKDIINKYKVHNGYVIVLKIGGVMFSYLYCIDKYTPIGTQSDRLYTMDEYGNKKSSSCFRFLNLFETN